jgi:hypothetical protein
MEQTLRICVIGAGACGLTTGKNLLQAGLRNFVIYDRGFKVGGNWVYSPSDRHSSVYEFTHTISSKSLSQFPDFPFPEDCPAYPSHTQVASYFEKYAQHFGVTDHVCFGKEVTCVRKLAERKWQVTLADDTSQQFEALFVCNGHHWSPRMPSYPGSFSGRVLHSHDFKEARSFAADRVLVVGAGNSGCDIAVKMAETARSAALSLRHGYHIVPKFIFGVPSDVVLRYIRWLPRPPCNVLVVLPRRSQTANHPAAGCPSLTIHCSRVIPSSTHTCLLMQDKSCWRSFLILSASKAAKFDSLMEQRRSSTRSSSARDTSRAFPSLNKTSGPLPKGSFICVCLHPAIQTCSLSDCFSRSAASGRWPTCRQSLRQTPC